MDVEGLQLLQGHECAEFSALHLEYSAGFSQPTHFHEEPTLVLVTSGLMDDRCPLGDRESNAGTALFRPKGELHSTLFPECSSCLCIRFNPAWEEGLGTHFADLSSSSSVMAPVAQGAILQTVRELYASDSLLGLEAAISDVMLLLSRQTMPKQTTMPSWLKKARYLLDDELSETPCLLKLSDLVGVHPTHLNRGFRQFFRCTVGEYVRQRRMHVAMQRLREGEESIGDIAMALGFADQSHFTRTFRLYVGVTPTQFRSRH